MEKLKAPDKIYIRDFGKTLCKVWTYDPGKHKGDVDVKYVNKDVLLGWLESKVYEHNEDRFDDGYNTALGQVIDYLNSI